MENGTHDELGKTEIVKIPMPSRLMEKLDRVSRQSGKKKGEIIKEWLHTGQESDDSDRVTLRLLDPDTGLSEIEMDFYLMEPPPQKK